MGYTRDARECCLFYVPRVCRALLKNRIVQDSQHAVSEAPPFSREGSGTLERLIRGRVRVKMTTGGKTGQEAPRGWLQGPALVGPRGRLPGRRQTQTTSQGQRGWSRDQGGNRATGERGRGERKKGTRSRAPPPLAF